MADVARVGDEELAAGEGELAGLGPALLVVGQAQLDAEVADPVVADLVAVDLVGKGQRRGRRCSRGLTVRARSRARHSGLGLRLRRLLVDVGAELAHELEERDHALVELAVPRQVRGDVARGV